MDVITHLSQLDMLSYINIIQPLKEGVAQVLIADEDGVLIEVEHSTYAVVLFNPNQVEKFAKVLLPITMPIAVYDEALVSYLQARGIEPSISCVQAVYTSKEMQSVDQNLTIRPLAEADIELITAHYSRGDEAYITERVRSQTMIGIEVAGSLAAFMGRHSEGAMGLLEVLPQYRRRHFGQELEKAYINRMLASNLVPYCNVETTNTASLALQKKLGLVIAEKQIHWYIPV